MKTILFIHQSSELYGSDKTLFELVNGFRKKGHHPIVVLPQPGPLKSLMDANGIEVIVTPVIKISRSMFGPLNLLSLPFQTNRSLRHIHKMVKGRGIDLVYSNTLAVLIGVFYAARRKIKHVWHVHEIVEHPRLIKKIFVRLLSLRINKRIIHNSFATKKFWESDGRLSPDKNVVVWNGLTDPATYASEEQKRAIRTELFGAGPQSIVIGLVGRINRWKGQKLLLEALAPLMTPASRLSLVFIGSIPPGQPRYLEELKVAIKKLQLENVTRIIPFQNNIWPLWEALDIAAVPSTEPEPFGLVALEAMLCRKPVVAADHGGLSEIVEDGKTGFLFEPGNPQLLREKLTNLIVDDRLRHEMGNKGRERAIHYFSAQRYIDEIEKVCLSITTL